MKIIWTFTLLMIPGVLSSISVTGYSGGGVSITCRYDRRYRDNKKYFCEGEWSSCSYLIKTNKKNKWVDSGRFSLYDDTRAAVFTVTIRDLSEQDSGTYRCAVDKSGIDFYTEVNLNVVAGQQIRTMTGYSEGNIIMNFKYEMQQKNLLIDVCNTEALQCFTLINTDRAAEWTHDGRFSVHDDRSKGFLHVFIRDLNVKDSGEYKIIVTVSEDYSFFSEFYLDIKKADCCQKSISLSAAAGGSVNISCRYPQSHSADVKFVCRRSGSDLCAEETSVKESRRWSAEGQMQLYDDREQQLLTGIISHVTQQHSAEYWCGVQSDQGHKSFITRVLVSVTDITKTNSPPPPPPSSSSPSSSLSSSSSPTSSSSPPKSSSSSSSSSASSFSSVRSPLITSVSKSSPSSFTSAGSSLIVPLVLVLLVLIIVGLLFLFLCKKHQSRAGGDSSSQTRAGKHEVVSHTACDYEEIQDSHKQLPTHPSDSSNTVYATAQLPTNPSVSPDTVYATAQLPTNPSVSPDCVYATVQKDTGDSQILITSAEDLNYSVVNFQKKADCPDSVRLRNNQDYSEYAAVNHLTD
ncbi:polymeric immunoglobulin receptor-like isoform X2 [Cyprinus carpio]|uniref:polymeric immunoglobulin receptor-like isoform X2 n=1 Tax=Cyprinus carpio TaxID=7962 RepID=UPI001C5A017D|nr:polymeric immunoglobulin receptor-like isoform X2 [Cyprinus carpio]